MKIAYIIFAYNNPKHLFRLINALNNENVSFYIHINSKTNINDFIFPAYSNIHLYSDRKDSFWGGSVLTMLTIEILGKIIQENFDYYILLSGADYPIKSNKYIIDFFKRNNGYNFIDIWRMPLRGKTFDRVDYYYFAHDLTNHTYKNYYFRILNYFIRKLHLKRKFPDRYDSLKLYGGDTWWALTHICVKYILKYLSENYRLLNFYKHTFASEEMLFHTIIGNSVFSKKIKQTPTYAVWKKKTLHPEMIKEKIIDNIFREENAKEFSKYLFARKFNDSSEPLIKKIDSYIRNN